MNQRTVNTIYGIIILLLTAGIAYVTFHKKPATTTNVIDRTNSPANNSNNTPTPNTTSGTVYENDYMKITIPEGWTAAEATQAISVGNCTDKQNCTEKTQKQPDPAAVNITKGNYILYINTKAMQASGVEGGRFAEIAMGAPSADAVVTTQPSPECGSSEVSSSTVFGNYNRVDLYVGPSDKTDWCNVPTNKTVWYFSFVSGGGYFNYYDQNHPENGALVVTMAYNTKDVNKLPVKGSAELNTALNEMTGIIKTLEIKKK